MTGTPFDADAVRKLAAILTETGLTEIEIAGKDSRIRVARTPAPVATPFTAPGHAAAGPDGTGSARIAGSGAPAAPLLADLSQHPGAIVSPMVGVVYRAPEPGALDYVTVGQTVTAGQTVLLIEAMKTFNQIKAPRSGTVSQILVVSGGPVEYGEVLMILE